MGGEAWGQLRANEWESKGSVSVQSEGKLFLKGRIVKPHGRLVR